MMIEKKNGYIQFPPLPEELDGDLVRVLWEYAKLPEADREATFNQFWELGNVNREKDTEEANVYYVDPENIAAFLESVRSVVAGLFREAIGLSQYVFEECFVNGKAVEDIMPEDPRMREAIWSVYMLFLEDEKESEDEEVLTQ